MATYTGYALHKRHVQNGVDPVPGCGFCDMRLVDPYTKPRRHSLVIAFEEEEDEPALKPRVCPYCGWNYYTECPCRDEYDEEETSNGDR